MMMHYSRALITVWRPYAVLSDGLTIHFLRYFHAFSLQTPHSCTPQNFSVDDLRLYCGNRNY